MRALFHRNRSLSRSRYKQKKRGIETPHKKCLGDLARIGIRHIVIETENAFLLEDIDSFSNVALRHNDRKNALIFGVILFAYKDLFHE